MAFETDDPPLAERRIPAGDDFLAPAELAALTPEIIVERMKALAPRIAAAAVEAERLRRPVDEIWAAIRASGYFYMYVPKAFGGLEVTTDQFIDASLPIAEACASTGWVASFCAEHNWILAHFPVETQAALFGGDFPYIIAPVVSAPPGMATPVEGGYRVTARWKWGTGIMHADWVGGSAIVVKPEGPPQVLTVRRLELTQMAQQGQQIPPPVVMLLNTPKGQARVIPAPGPTRTERLPVGPGAARARAAVDRMLEVR